ncbi:MAG: hypothetical protein J5629_00535 [Muribaculaceae bacterium]|nr:hypothetical protein [Muribaculaceae bacterium]
MKKIFTLFAVALIGLSAYAQWPGCPSRFEYAQLTNEANRVEIELQLVNASENLNGFNMQVQKPETAQWVMIDDIFEFYSTNEGYGATILANWTGHTAAQMEAAMPKMMDYNTSINPNGNLVIIEILKTNACYYFPVLTEPAGVSKFAIDFSTCEDGVYEVKTDNTPQQYSFSYTNGPEEHGAWTPTEEDSQLVLQLEKTGDEVKIYDAISTIAVDQPADNRIFDLQGRELQSVPEHGIYIQNGKKYVK